MTNRHFFTDAQSSSPREDDGNGESMFRFTDTASATLEYAGDGDFTDDFHPSDADTVTLDTPWENFFGTDEYVRFDATVAQPIVQPYVIKGQFARFKKDEDALRRAQAQLDNLPWTMGHPEGDRVTRADEIRGFWKNPRWNDGQEATLYVPANDDEAVQFAYENESVSIGFSGDIRLSDDADYDGEQYNFAYDHVASVENTARCPPERGCGIHTDTSPSHPEHNQGSQGNIPPSHGHVTDVVRSVSTEEDGDPEMPDVPESDEWNEGDWVSFHADGEYHHGKITYVDAERALVHRYDTESEELSDEATTVATASLSEWVGPYADSCPGDHCSCGCHTTMTGTQFTDAPDGLYEADGEWFAVAPDEHSKDSTDHPNDAMYPVGGCGDVQDAWNLRGHGEDLDIDQSTLEARIKRTADAQDCPDSQRPWTDNDTTTDSMTDIQDFIDQNDLSAEDVIDDLDVEVPDEPTAFYDGEPTADDLADDFDSVDLLLDEKDELEDKVEDLQDSLHEAKRPIFEDKAEELAEHTHKWGDKSTLMEKFDDGEWTTDDIDEKIEIVEDLKGDDTTTVTDSVDGNDSSSESTDFDTTNRGKYKLADPR